MMTMIHVWLHFTQPTDTYYAKMWFQHQQICTFIELIFKNSSARITAYTLNLTHKYYICNSSFQSTHFTSDQKNVLHTKNWILSGCFFRLCVVLTVEIQKWNIYWNGEKMCDNLSLSTKWFISVKSILNTSIIRCKLKSRQPWPMAIHSFACLFASPHLSIQCCCFVYFFFCTVAIFTMYI